MWKKTLKNHYTLKKKNTMWHTPATIAIRVSERKQNFAEIEMQRNPTKPLALEIHSELFFSAEQFPCFCCCRYQVWPPGSKPGFSANATAQK